MSMQVRTLGAEFKGQVALERAAGLPPSTFLLASSAQEQARAETVRRLGARSFSTAADRSAHPHRLLFLGRTDGVILKIPIPDR